MTRRENHCRRILSLSMQQATVPSDEVSSKSDCENRYNRLKPVDTEVLRKVLMRQNPKWKLEINDMPVLGLAGRH